MAIFDNTYFCNMPRELQGTGSRMAFDEAFAGYMR